MRYRRGFTLIELSIVLVIIGLIVGGVLTGRELIATSTNRKVIKDIESYNTALNAFRSKYACIPGDCKNASTFFTGAINGNDDGLIFADVVTYDGYWEVYTFWKQLGDAGLINGTYSGGPPPYAIMNPQFVFRYHVANLNVPVSAYGGRSGYCMFGNEFRLGGSTDQTHPRICDEGFLSPFQAYYLDSKMDDGMPETGGVRSDQPNYVYNNGIGTATDCFTATTPKTYNTATGALHGCIQRYKANF